MNQTEIEKSKHNVVYFVENYVTLKTHKGMSPIKLLDFQKDILENYETIRNNIYLQARQSYWSTTTNCFLTHYCTFQSNKIVVLLVMKYGTDKIDQLDKLSGMLNEVPNDFKVWNKLEDRKTLVTSNNVKVVVMTPQDYLACEDIADLVIWDNMAYHKNLRKLWSDLMSKLSVSSVTLSSQPTGSNYFKDLWEGALDRTNGFTPTRVDWWMVPNRDEKWAENMKECIGSEVFKSQYGLEFID